MSGPSRGPQSQAVWQDFDVFLNQFIPKQTIPTLRSFADRIYANANINLNLRSQERKADLVDKVKTAFLTLRNKDQQQTYLQTRRACESIAAAVGGRTFEARAYTPPQPTFGGALSLPSRMGTPTYGGAAAGPSRAGWTSANTQTAYHRAAPQLQDWKPSPIWRPVRALTNMEMLPDILSSDDNRTRREKKIHFSLNPEVIDTLNKTRDLVRTNPAGTPQHSVRIFCASSDYFRPQNLPSNPYNEHVNNRRIPIEYPSNPDAAVDGYSVPFKDKGLRGRPGSAPPLDIDKGTHGLTRIAGRMASVTMGHTGPTIGKKKDQSKKFWFQLVFVEITPMEALMERLNALPPTDAEQARVDMRKKAEEDDDIEVGTSVLSLKDPLAGMRIVKPVRSSKCSHIQCFDVRWWIHANSSHPQWLCPHCSKELNIDDMICDGYVLSILTACPDDVDEVVIEPNGEWHTENNQYASPAWAAEHPPSEPAPRAATKRERSPTDSPVKGKRPAIELLSDDSDADVPSGPTTVPVSNGTSAQSSAPPRPTMSRTSSAAPAAAAVIDLTLSSDEDDDDEGAGRPAVSARTGSASSPGFRQPGAVGSGPGAAFVTRTLIGHHPHEFRQLAGGRPLPGAGLASYSSAPGPPAPASLAAPYTYPNGTPYSPSTSPLDYIQSGGPRPLAHANGHAHGDTGGSGFRPFLPDYGRDPPRASGSGANGFAGFASPYPSPSDAMRVDASLYSPGSSGSSPYGAGLSLACPSVGAPPYAPSPLSHAGAGSPSLPNFGQLISRPAPEAATGGEPSKATSLVAQAEPAVLPQPYVSDWDDEDLGAYASDDDRPPDSYFDQYL
ncbi:E3 SUMO-protein ligase pli1 [Cryptotrichosporon argae]